MDDNKSCKQIMNKKSCEVFEHIVGTSPKNYNLNYSIVLDPETGKTSSFDESLLETKNCGRIYKITYDKKPFFLETPWLFSTFGLNLYNMESKIGSIDLTFVLNLKEKLGEDMKYCWYLVDHLENLLEKRTGLTISPKTIDNSNGDEVYNPRLKATFGIQNGEPLININTFNVSQDDLARWTRVGYGIVPTAEKSLVKTLIHVSDIWKSNEGEWRIKYRLHEVTLSSLKLPSRIDEFSAITVKRKLPSGVKQYYCASKKLKMAIKKEEPEKEKAEKEKEEPEKEKEGPEKEKENNL